MTEVLAATVIGWWSELASVVAASDLEQNAKKDFSVPSLLALSQSSFASFTLLIAEGLQLFIT